jgi:alanyl-tRNA synthetase
LTEEEKKSVEEIVNGTIGEALPVKRIETTLDEAIKMGSQAVFEGRYEEKVSVYSIGDFSLELCSGPHVENTGELGRFKIVKEEGISAGVRRIRAVLE